MKIKFMIYLLFIAINANSQKSQALYSSAEKKLNTDDFQGAVEEYSKAIELNQYQKIDTNNYQVNDYLVLSYFYRAAAKNKLEDHRGALLDYNKALQLTQSSEAHENWRIDLLKSIYTGRGFTKYTLGDYRGAIADYDNGFKYSQFDPNLFYNKGLAYEELKDTKSALSSYRSAELFYGKQPSAKVHFRLGLLEIKMGQKNNGCLNLSKAGELGYMDAYEKIRQLCN